VSASVKTNLSDSNLLLCNLRNLQSLPNFRLPGISAGQLLRGPDCFGAHLGFVLKIGIAMRINEVLTPARLIFFGAGLRETLQVDGRALVVRDQALRHSMASNGHASEHAPTDGTADGLRLWTGIVASLKRR
jgi:hypothetical protein